MTSEAVVSLFTASLAATEQALADEFIKARQAESALATAHARIQELEMELLLARAESAQWRNRFEREAERRVWESERRTTGSAQPDEEEHSPAPHEPSPPATTLKQPDDPTPPATATLQEPRSLIAASSTVEPVASPPVSSPPPSSLPHFTRTPALPRVEQIGPMSVKVYVEQDRYPKAINLVGRVIGPNCATLKAIEADSGCVVRVRAEGSKNDFFGPPYVLIHRDGPGCQAGLAKVHEAAARVQKILTPPPHGRDELWLQQHQRLRELDAARGVGVRLPKVLGSRSTPSLVRSSETCPVSSPPPSMLPHFTSPASQFRGAPYVLVRREGRACRAGAAKVHDAVVLVQHILTPPLHGRDELWLQQQQQRLRVMDAERAAVLQSKAVASRSTLAVVRLSEATGEQTTPAFDTHSTPTVVRPSEQTTPAFGSRSTTAVVRPNEARETTDVQATPPAFGTRSNMVPVQQLQQKLSQQQLQQSGTQLQHLPPKEKQSKPRQQQQQSGQKEAPIGIWRL